METTCYLMFLTRTGFFKLALFCDTKGFFKLAGRQGVRNGFGFFECDTKTCRKRLLHLKKNLIYTLAQTTYVCVLTQNGLQLFM